MKKILISVILAVGAQTGGAQNFVPQQVQTIIYVKPDGTGNGSSWENACNLEHAVGNKSAVGVGFTPTPPPNAQIWVQTGTYYPSEMLTIPDSVKMYGGFAGTETDLSQRDFASNATIIDAQKKFGSVARLSPFSELNGFTIQNGSAQNNPHKNGGGIWADDNSIIANCKIINNSASLNGGGIYAKGPIKIENCIIENNTAIGGSANAHGNCISGLTAPIINKHPNAAEQRRGVGLGFSALSVSVVGNAPFSYQWYSNTANNNTSGTPISGATDASYTPPSITVGTSYYYCEITDSSGTVVSNVSGAHVVHTVTAPNCNSNTPGWGAGGLGTITWGESTDIEATARTITNGVITQVWSAPVRTSACTAKTSYAGGSSNNYNADCRVSSPGYQSSGDLFSWCAVIRYASVLCPYPWRVPTKDDFINLDKAMGGTGANRSGSSYASFISTNYIKKWGGAYCCFSNANGTLSSCGSYMLYWSQTVYNADSVYDLDIGSSYIYPQDNGTTQKNLGFTLRCVR